MADTDVRDWVTSTLKPLLPKGWKVLSYATNIDKLAPNEPVVMLRLKSVERFEPAPLSQRKVTYTLTIIEPKTAPGPADEALDDKLIDLLNALDLIPNVVWTSAEAVVFGDPESAVQNPAFDIAIEFIIEKEGA